MKMVLVVITTMLLGGCTTWDLGHKWTKTGVAAQQLTLDDIDCRRLASDAGSAPESFVGGFIDAVRAEVDYVQRVRAYDRCMTDRGYARVATPSWLKSWL